MAQHAAVAPHTVRPRQGTEVDHNSVPMPSRRTNRPRDRRREYSQAWDEFLRLVADPPPRENKHALDHWLARLDEIRANLRALSKPD